MAKNGAEISYECIFVRLVLLICMTGMISAVSFAEEDASTSATRESQLQVSVGDFQIVVETPPWAWGMPEDPETFYKGYNEGVARRGEPCYLRDPRSAHTHASMPNLICHPVTGDILMRYTPYHDTDPEHRMAGFCISYDQGRNWTPPVLNKYVDTVGPFKKGWIGLSYIAGYNPDAPLEPKIQVSRSDDGIHWVPDKTEAPIIFPQNMRPTTYDKPCRGRYKKKATLATYKQIIEYKGALYASGYGEFNDDKMECNILIRSEDEGKTWHFVSVMGLNYEPGFCVLPNDNMIALHRSTYSREPRPLLQTYSTDGGQSWSDVFPAPGVELVTNEDRKFFSEDGRLFTHPSGALIDPSLVVMDSGIIALLYGRPGLHLRFSVDGKGKYWSDRTTILPKYARDNEKLKGHIFPSESEYNHAMGGMVALSERTLLVASNLYGYSATGDINQGRDVIFVVPVSIRKLDEKCNSTPTICGPKKSNCAPGRRVSVKFDLKDPDGDWVCLVCPETSDVEIKSNTVSFAAPWEFKGLKKIKVMAEDAWGLRSKEHTLTIRSDGKDN